LWQAERVSQTLVNVLDHYTELAARDMAVRLQLLAHAHGDIDGNRERHALVATRTSVDLRVDTDDFTAHVEQWATRVTGVDRYVCLDERDVAGVRERASFCTDDARGDAVLETERRTNRDDPFAYLQVVRVTEFHSRQVFRGNADDSDVALCIYANDLGCVFATVGKAYGDFARAVHDVGVSQDRAVGTHDEARALTVHRSLLRRLHWEAAEELSERILATERALTLRALTLRARVITVVGTIGALVALGVGRRNLGYNTDVDDGRAVLLHHRAEVREHCIWVTRGGCAYGGRWLCDARRCGGGTGAERVQRAYGRRDSCGADDGGVQLISNETSRGHCDLLADEFG
jgi:hypothetical protein